METLMNLLALFLLATTTTEDWTNLQEQLIQQSKNKNAIN